VSSTTAPQYGDALQHSANTAIGLIGRWLFQKAIPAFFAIIRAQRDWHPHCGKI
jgi:hypothetical protein